MRDAGQCPTICHVLLDMDMGGAEVLASGLARSLNDRFQFVFACLDEMGTIGNDLSQEGFPVGVIHREDGIDWKCGLRLSTFLRKHKVSVIHAHQYTPFFQSLVSRLAYRKPPIVFTEHGRHYPDVRSPKRVAFNRLMVRGDDRLVGVGRSVRQALIDNEGLASNRVEVIYNGVDIRPFESVRGDVALRRRIREELGLKSDEYAIFQVARLNHLKDHATGIRALSRLRQGGLPARLILVGDGDEQSQLEKQAKELHCRDDVTFLGERTDIPALLTAADTFLLTSISEGIPLTLIEAMAAGVPVVSTDVGGVSEVVLHNESGLLSVAKDDAQLATNLQRLHGDSDLRRQFVLSGCERAGKLFAQQRMHEEYAQLYEDMSAGRSGGRRSSGQTVVRSDRLQPVGG